MAALGKVNFKSNTFSYDELTQLGHVYLNRRCMEDLEAYLNDKYTGPELSQEDKEKVAYELYESVENTILYELNELISKAIDTINRQEKGGACNGE